MTGLIHCEPLEPPHNGKLIYANEHGRIESKTNYPMGTFAEVQCMNETVVKGEGFLSCIDSGIWDFPVPECVPIQIKSTTTEAIPVLKTTTTTTTTSTAAPTTTKATTSTSTSTTTRATTIRTTTSSTTTATTKKPVTHTN